MIVSSQPPTYCRCYIARYDNFAERLEQIDVSTVRERILRGGLVPERFCYELLHCYRRSELAQAAERVIGADILFTPGIGLYEQTWLAQLKSSVTAWLRVMHNASLSNVVQEMRQRWLELSTCEDATIEALLGLWPEIQISRTSIFEAAIEVVDEQEPAREDSSVAVEEIIAAKGVKKQVREKRVATKKRSVIEQEATQGDLWG